MNPMALKIGDLISISSGHHMYPENWKMGDEPIRFNQFTSAIFLEKKEIPPISNDPRIFIKIITSQGIGWINSDFIKTLQ
jgi:hypothetical protein